MALRNYVFMMIGKGYRPPQVATLQSEFFRTTVICVEDIDMACEEAAKLKGGDTQLIELCGAFKGEMVDKIIDAVDGTIGVGNMSMRDSERAKLMQAIG